MTRRFDMKSLTQGTVVVVEDNTVPRGMARFSNGGTAIPGDVRIGGALPDRYDTMYLATPSFENCLAFAMGAPTVLAILAS